MSESTKPQRAHLRWGRILAFLAVAGLAIWAYSEFGRGVIPLEQEKTLAGMDAFKAYIVAKFPQNPSKPTFYIPKEFVYPGGTVAKDGVVQQVLIEYELPAKTPIQDHSSMKEGTPEHSDFMKTWIGRFGAELNGSLASTNIDFLMRRGSGDQSGVIGPAPADSIVRDGNIDGLIRYSSVFCFDAGRIASKDPKDLRDPFIKNTQELYKKALANRPPDDPVTRPYCFVNRDRAEYFTAPEATPTVEQVHINCVATGCDMAVNIWESWAVRVRMSPKNIPRWREISRGTRELFLSFLTEPPHSAATRSDPQSLTSNSSAKKD